MAYTPINWDEVTPITPTNLNKMDGQIDTNENDLRTIQNSYPTVNGQITENSSRISTNENELDTIQGGTASVDGRITNLENGTTGTNATTYKGNDIDTNGDGKVNSAVNADSADAVSGYNLTVIASGTLTGSAVYQINLNTTAQNNYYMINARYTSAGTGSSDFISIQGAQASVNTDRAYIQYNAEGQPNDRLILENIDNSLTVKYSVLGWE